MYCNILKREFQWFPSYNIDFGIDFYSETLWWIKYTWSWTCQMQYRLWIYSFLCFVEKEDNYIFVFEMITETFQLY